MAKHLATKDNTHHPVYGYSYYIVKGCKGIFLADHLHMTIVPALPLVKPSFKSTICCSRDFTVPVDMKDYLPLTQHCTMPILSSVASIFKN